jgi:hypothetical protein
MNAHSVAKGSQPFIFPSSPNCQGAPGVIREQSRESSLIEREESVNSTRSCLCVHFQRKVKAFRQRSTAVSTAVTDSGD